MAKKQSRRSISVHRGVYSALSKYAKQIGKPMAAIVEERLIEILPPEDLVEFRTSRDRPLATPPRQQMTLEEKWADATARANAPLTGNCRKEGCRIAGVHKAHP